MEFFEITEDTKALPGEYINEANCALWFFQPIAKPDQGIVEREVFYRYNRQL